MSQLYMERPCAGGLPDIPLPDGYQIRIYRPGDEPALARIYQECRLGTDTVDAVQRTIVNHPAFKPERIFVAEHAAEIVGTAATWTSPDDLGPAYLHMVGVLMAHRGKRLGEALCVQAIRQAADEGFTHQRLLTDDWRETAIRLYLDLGFYPLYLDRSHPGRWKVIALRLNRPEILDSAKVARLSKPFRRISRIVRRVRRYL